MFLLETNNGETSNQYLTALKDVWRNQSATVYGYSYKATEMVRYRPVNPVIQITEPCASSNRFRRTPPVRTPH
ncbi:hypothetical protein RvY_12063-2 [Ramazzottius varieornatus]|uniref:Uncharacterized protein n=1 Tax=Ramazzottius varieornatus TaxID=947166 RepID=A0A1D1VQW1_RAMVA|nr:hypothetical protein RvY_12063-2 [Ramazzottius varieornatus]